MAHRLLKTLVALAKALPLVVLALFTEELQGQGADIVVPLMGHTCPDAARHLPRTGVLDVDNHYITVPYRPGVHDGPLLQDGSVHHPRPGGHRLPA